MGRSTDEKRVLVALLVLAAGLRAGALWHWQANLSDDRDAYLGIARALAETSTYANPGTGKPTAYRPPLYPLIVSALVLTGHLTAALAVLHILLGLGTIMLTDQLGRQLGLGRLSLLAALLVAVDPLSVFYTTFPMTETLATFLTVLLMVLLTRFPPGEVREEPESGQSSVPPMNSDKATRRQRVLHHAACGFTFGLCALCRPTIWAFGLILAIAALPLLYRTVRRGGRSAPLRQFPWAAVLAASVVVAPWVIRNAIVLGHPIGTTTHGGYTLLLGNNPLFYTEVVSKPWGTVWEDAPPGRTHGDWYREVERAMTREIGPAPDEVARDRWMYQRAVAHISEAPWMFLRACQLRLLRFWNVAPLGPARNSVPDVVAWGVAGLYIVETFGLVVGLLTLPRRRSLGWGLLVLLMLSFTAVHLIYWSNVRMRSPLIPIIAVVSVSGLQRGGRSRAASAASSERP